MLLVLDCLVISLKPVWTPFMTAHFGGLVSVTVNTLCLYVYIDSIIPFIFFRIFWHLSM